jgi:hypothetical protein
MQTNRPGRLPWDLEQAMTAFQVRPSWYEDYWLKPLERRRPPGLIARIFRKTSSALRETPWRDGLLRNRLKETWHTTASIAG